MENIQFNEDSDVESFISMNNDVYLDRSDDETDNVEEAQVNPEILVDFEDVYS